MRESRTYGSVRGARGNSRPYRETPLCCAALWSLMAQTAAPTVHFVSGVEGLLPRQPVTGAAEFDPQRHFATAD